jgi:3-polyprenyl-4-hydroxybenzoate decarboxylase
VQSAQAAGIPEVKGHEAGGSRFMLMVSIKRLYDGHAKQPGMVAASGRMN